MTAAPRHTRKPTGKVIETGRASKIMTFQGLDRVPVDEARAGDIISLAGLTVATVANTIAAGVKALLSGLEVSVRLRAKTDTNPPYLAIDAISEFIDSIEVYPQGNIQDPAEPGTFCEFLPSANIEDNWADNYGIAPGSDGHDDTVKDLVPGTRICFRIKAKSNVSVPQTAQVRVASARNQVQAKN